MVATAGKDGIIKIWNTQAKQCVQTLSGHTDLINRVIWLGDGLLITCSRDKTVKLWNSTGSQLRSLSNHSHWVNTMDATPYNEASAPRRIAAGSEDTTISLYEYPSFDLLKVLTGHQGSITDVRFSPNGKFLASSSYDKSIKIWDAETGNFLASLRGHTAAVYQIIWSPDSLLLASAGKDCTVKIWNMSTFKIQKTLTGHTDEVFALDWRGSTLVSGGKDLKIKLWK